MPKGNKSIKNYGFTTNRSESLIKKISLCITESMYQKLISLEDKNEFIRLAIQEKLDRMIGDN